MNNTLTMKVKCPRCGKIHDVPQGITEIDCDCHLFCPDGEKPTDCSVTSQSFSGQAGWPTGLHRDAKDEGDDEMYVTYYCSTHGKKYFKTPIIIPVDWNVQRLSKDLRWHGGRI